MSHRGRGGFGRGGHNFFSQNHSAQNRNKFNARFMKVPQKAANPLNQYYLDKFIKIKRDADQKSLQNISKAYKHVICALSKYPLPILSAQQTMFLEGVGEVIATKFNEMIETRQKEFEDGVFNLELLKAQKQKISDDYREFAGFVFTDEELQSLSEMSLKQYLVARDQRNYRIQNGLEDPLDSKKRKHDEMSKEEEDGEDGQKKKKVGKSSDFLDIGSVSWSMLLACFFLVLHDDRKTFYINFEGIKEMLEVLKQEFKDYVPFENDLKMLEKNAADDLIRFRDNQFIEIIESSQKDPLQWKFIMTDKGKNRAKSLCKSVGILVTVEIDIENPTTNKITINLYDKDVMPIVDELYYGDTTSITKIKKELENSTTHNIFGDYVTQIEGEIDQILMESVKDGGNSKLKHENESMMMSEIFNQINIDDEEDEDENDDKDQQSRTLADELMALGMNEKENSNTINTKQKIVKNEVACEEIECDVVLYVDNREKKNQQQGNYLYKTLNESQIYCEQKALPLGDFIWILRVRQYPKNYKDEEAIDDEEEKQGSGKKRGPKGSKIKKTKKKAVVQEYIDYVLDFIVERKTADDLAASIMDGRYEEQKFRLKNCGINNVIYLVEGKAGQYTKIPTQVLQKAQIHTQIFHGFNVLRLNSMNETLKWLTDMTKDIKKKVAQFKKTNPNFAASIADSLIDFKHFASESGKNSNLNVQQIFARQLRTIKGLGIENVSTITRVFKTPNLLYRCYKKCVNDEKQSYNLLNAGKMELLRNQLIYKQGLHSDQMINTLEDGQPTLPKTIDDIDRMNLDNILNASMPKLFCKILRNFEIESGTKMRKINKNQCKNIYDLFYAPEYSSLEKKKSKGKGMGDDEDMAMDCNDIDEQEF